MEEIQVREYVRLARNQGINKIIDEDDDGFLILDVIIADEYGDECFEIALQDINKEILKHSKNIIDLIEKDDYINGEKVIDIFNPEFLSLGELPYVRTQNNKYEEQDIKTILTKEQMENNCYRIEE